MDRAPIDAITEVQHSLITTAQFLSVTGSAAALRWAVDDGWLERYRDWRGVYALAGAPVTPYQPHMAASLLAGSHAAVSGFPAGFLWDSPDILDAAPEVTFFGVPPRRIRHVTVRRSRLPAAGRIDIRYGIPTVSAPMLAIQLTDLGSSFLAERVVTDFMKRNIPVVVPTLLLLDEVTAPTKAMRDLHAFCTRQLRVKGHDDSPPARDLGIAMLEAGVPPFVTQFHVCVEGHDYVLDFAWPEFKVLLEYAGRADHGTTWDQVQRDAVRRSRLTAAGWLALDATAIVDHGEVIRWVFASLAGRGFRRDSNRKRDQAG